MAMFGLKFKAVHKDVAEGTTLAQVRDELLQLMEQENTHHHRMGQLYNYVVDKKLAENAGYKDAPEYFHKNLADLSQSALAMYGAVARNFSGPISVRFGVTCLSLLLVYKEVADMEVDHEEPGPTVIEVPGEKGEVTNKPFSVCSVEEMRQAIKRKRKPSSSKPLPEEEVAQAEQYREALVGQFPRGVVVKVEVRNQKGKAVMDFMGVPVGQVRRLVEALLVELPDENPEPKPEQALPVAPPPVSPAPEPKKVLPVA
jgi:hypothetical protein